MGENRVMARDYCLGSTSKRGTTTRPFKGDGHRANHTAQRAPKRLMIGVGRSADAHGAHS